MHWQDKKDVWLKAAVIGSLWGASEIVLGSFLHNLKIPFSGNILTSIGIVLMVSGHRIWPEKGVLFRAGLICAALKSLSPSAVILGPMLAIFMQASLMELAVSLGRKSWPAYLIGGGLAMSYNLIYRIFSSLVLYGMTFVELYQNLVSYLMEQLGITGGGYWTPILILLIIFFLTGMTAGAAGIWISRQAAAYQDKWKLPEGVLSTNASLSPASDSSPGSLAVPVFMLLLLAAGLYSIRFLPTLAAMGMLVLFLWLSWLYDHQILARFIRKKGFWVGIVVMLLLATLLMGDSGNNSYFSLHGFIAGLEMIMRALYVITGFGLISKSIRSSRAARIFMGKRGSRFYQAVQIAFQTTPLFMQVIPGREHWKNPARVLTHMVGNMKHSLDYIKDQHKSQSTVFILTGLQGAGKTTFARQLAKALTQKGIQAGGILAQASYKHGINTSYAAEDISNGSQQPLIARQHGPEGEKGPFVFNEDGLRFGRRVMSESVVKDDLVILDEIGPFELKNLGWHETLAELTALPKKPMLWIVRESLISQVLEKYAVHPLMIMQVGQITPKEAAEKISQYILRH